MDKNFLYKFLEDTAVLMEDASPDQRRRIYEKLSKLKLKLSSNINESMQVDSQDYLEER